MVRFLHLLNKTSRMEINQIETKSCAYWFDKYRHKRFWLDDYDWTLDMERGFLKTLRYSFLGSTLRQVMRINS